MTVRDCVLVPIKIHEKLTTGKKLSKFKPYPCPAVIIVCLNVMRRHNFCRCSITLYISNNLRQGALHLMKLLCSLQIIYILLSFG